MHSSPISRWRSLFVLALLLLLPFAVRPALADDEAEKGDRHTIG